MYIVAALGRTAQTSRNLPRSLASNSRLFGSRGAGAFWRDPRTTHPPQPPHCEDAFVFANGNPCRVHAEVGVSAVVKERTNSAHRVPRRQVVRQFAPRTPSAQHIQDAIEYFTPGEFRRCSSLLGLGDHWPYNFPLFIAHVARIWFSFSHPNRCNMLIAKVQGFYSAFSTCSKTLWFYEWM